ncbi:MAG: hypothetical protein OXE96_02030 [Gemmatimonadetes bacterium]|nr:hypothetical protein [Gemmatimonadota bacterium]
MMKTREMIRARRRRVVAGVIALVAMAVFPDVAHACPVCFDRDDEARIAFLATTGLLTVLPLGLVAGTGWWLRKRVREVEAKADRQEARGR